MASTGPADIEKIYELRGRGLSLREIASQTGISKTTVSRLLKTVPQKPSISGSRTCMVTGSIFS